MANGWIVDMAHFLDASGAPAVRRGTLLPHLTAIVEAVLSTGSREEPTGVICRRRPQRRPCPGVIDALVEPDHSAIVWWCPACGDHGRIAGWQGTRWDRRPRPAAGMAHATTVTTSTPRTPTPPVFSPPAAQAWEQLAGAVRVRLLNNVFCVRCLGGTSMVLTGGETAGANLLLHGTCVECGGAVARVVEAVVR